MPYEDLIEKHFRRVGLDPAWGRKIMQVESGGDPTNVTGRYHGLMQLDKQEFKNNGGSGSIYDPEQNISAAANKMAREKLRFEQKYGREERLKDMYLIHQQGEGGYDAHMKNPDAPAWENMYSTKEGREKGVEWSKRAIWGNLSDKEKARFGSVENVTSGDFTGVWGSKMEAGGPWTGSEPKPDSYEAAQASLKPADAAAIERRTLLGRESEAVDKKKSYEIPFEPIETPQFGFSTPDIQLSRVDISAPTVPGLRRRA